MHCLICYEPYLIYHTTIYGWLTNNCCYCFHTYQEDDDGIMAESFRLQGWECTVVTSFEMLLSFSFRILRQYDVILVTNEFNRRWVLQWLVYFVCPLFGGTYYIILYVTYLSRPFPHTKWRVDTPDVPWKGVRKCRICTKASSSTTVLCTSLSWCV